MPGAGSQSLTTWAQELVTGIQQASKHLLPVNPQCRFKKWASENLTGDHKEDDQRAFFVDEVEIALIRLLLGVCP